RLLARQVLELFGRERFLDRAHALRPFGMAGRHDVIDTGGMRDEEGGHGCVLTPFFPPVIARESGRSSTPRPIESTRRTGSRLALADRSLGRDDGSYFIAFRLTPAGG